MKMLRICAALSAALLVPGMASAKELKPKFGDIDGVYYTDVAENREACRQAVQRKIYLCSQNTSFVSNTEDRKYPGCLPLFRRQAGICADHFRSEAYKCQGAGSVRIADFTGFACTVTATVVEEGDEPERREPEGGTGAREPAQQDRGAVAGLSPKCAGMGKGAKCWQELANRRRCYIYNRFNVPSVPFTWSGACEGGVAAGRGTLVRKNPRYSNEGTGNLMRGKKHGRWVERTRGSKAWDKVVWEIDYANGVYHGQVVSREGSFCLVTRYSHGKKTSKTKPC